MLGTETSPELLCAGLAWSRPAPAGPDTPTKQSPLPGHTKRAPRVLAACRPCPQAAQTANSCHSPVALWDLRVSPEQPQGLAPHYSSLSSLGGPLSPSHTHPEGHRSSWLCFLGQRLSCLSSTPLALEVGGRCGRISPALQPVPPTLGSPFQPASGTPTGPGRGSAHGGAPAAASGQRVGSGGPGERGAPPRGPLRGAAPSPAGSPELRAGLCSGASRAGGAGPERGSGAARGRPRGLGPWHPGDPHGAPGWRQAAPFPFLSCLGTRGSWRRGGSGTSRRKLPKPAQLTPIPRRLWGFSSVPPPPPTTPSTLYCMTVSLSQLWLHVEKRPVPVNRGAPWLCVASPPGSPEWAAFLP